MYMRYVVIVNKFFHLNIWILVYIWENNINIWIKFLCVCICSICQLPTERCYFLVMLDTCWRYIIIYLMNIECCSYFKGIKYDWNLFGCAYSPVQTVSRCIHSFLVQNLCGWFLIFLTHFHSLIFCTHSLYFCWLPSICFYSQLSLVWFIEYAIQCIRIEFQKYFVDFVFISFNEQLHKRIENKKFIHN